MSSFIDQTGRKVVISTPPQRIISLVPSQTELLSCLGLTDEVIAITKFCVHPASWFRTKKRIGGTKKLNVDTIINLQPQLVVANKEENVKEQIDSIAKHCPVWISDVFHLGSALEMIRQLGVICGKRAESERVAADIETKFSVLAEHQSQGKVRAAYLIWQQPFMTVGGDTFINDMLQRAGFENIFAQRRRYPEITLSELALNGCEVLFLSSEPYPFRQKHVEELQACLPKTKVLLVDGEMFSWYGSKLLQAPGYFAALRQRAFAS